MDGDFRVDIGEVIEQVEGAEVVSIFFPMLRKTLVVDLRYTLEDDPLIRLVSSVASPEERIHRLRRMRPQFPRPQDIALVLWPHHSSALVRTGVIDIIQKRLEETRRHSAVLALQAALRQVRRLEAEELARAITGEHYHTLWPNKR